MDIRAVRSDFRWHNPAKSKKIEIFLEIGPSTLLGLGRASLSSNFGTWLPSLKPDSECSTLLNSVGQLYVRGMISIGKPFMPKQSYNV